MATSRVSPNKERWNQTLKSRIPLENCLLPGDLSHEINAFVDHYNHRRYYESLKHLLMSPKLVYTYGATNTLRTKPELHNSAIALSNAQYERLMTGSNTDDA